jgi:hypothetical protein
MAKNIQVNSGGALAARSTRRDDHHPGPFADRPQGQEPLRYAVLHIFRRSRRPTGGTDYARPLAGENTSALALDVIFKDDQSRLRKGHGQPIWPSSDTS